MTFPRRPALSLRRLRLTVLDGPRPALHLTDSADPHCRHCNGEGGWIGGQHWDAWTPCTCWRPDWMLRLLPLPRRWADRRHPIDRRFHR
ncbi:hypothetical protein ABT095_25670 [Kitasatospora sp. NPDC002227]|uniref:hypothetical protein n=1 Tax=Kitasatospora sp. NPDC002227 TaxID=3154773 RepID=UPI00332326BB